MKKNSSDKPDTIGPTRGPFPWTHPLPSSTSGLTGLWNPRYLAGFDPATGEDSCVLMEASRTLSEPGYRITKVTEMVRLEVSEAELERARIDILKHLRWLEDERMWKAIRGER